MIERQEIHCHACDQYVQFDIEMDLNGNHILNCPNCRHQHCRVVKNGRITSERWSSRNGNTYIANYVTASTGSMLQAYQSITTTATSTSVTYLYDAWMSFGRN